MSCSTTSPSRRSWLVLWGRSTMGNQNGCHFQTWKVRLLHGLETPSQWNQLIYIRSWPLLFTFCEVKTAVAITRSWKIRRWTRQRRHDVCTCLTSRWRSMTSFQKIKFHACGVLSDSTAYNKVKGHDTTTWHIQLDWARKGSYWRSNCLADPSETERSCSSEGS